MDRTSILGDTIDYVNELTELIKILEEEIGATPKELNLLNTRKNFYSGSSEEMPMRNSTKVHTSLRQLIKLQDPDINSELIVIHTVCHRETGRRRNEDRHLLRHKPRRADLDG